MLILQVEGEGRASLLRKEGNSECVKCTEHVIGTHFWGLAQEFRFHPLENGESSKVLCVLTMTIIMTINSRALGWGRIAWSILYVFIVHNRNVRWRLLFSSFYRGGTCSSERLSNFSRFTQLTNDRAGIQTQNWNTKFFQCTLQPLWQWEWGWPLRDI